MISLIQIINKLQALVARHKGVKRFASDFPEQMQNIATKAESWPFVYAAPVQRDPLQNTNVITLDIYCWDILQKDRTNAITALSDCELILTDLYREIKFGTDYSWDVLNQPIITPLNNGLLDYTVGAVMRCQIEIETYCEQYIPLEPIVTEIADWNNDWSDDFNI